MSQVRKLLNGNLVPKAQEGYKFKLDSQDVYFTDDDLREIDNQIAALPVKYRMFLGNATNAMKSGNEFGNRGNNTLSRTMLSGLDEDDLAKLSSNGTFWQTLTGSPAYVAREAINEFLGIVSRVANKSKETPASTKKDLTNDRIELDFNTRDGKRYLSTTAGENNRAYARIQNIINHFNAGDNSEFNLKD